MNLRGGQTKARLELPRVNDRTRIFGSGNPFPSVQLDKGAKEPGAKPQAAPPIRVFSDRLIGQFEVGQRARPVAGRHPMHGARLQQTGATLTERRHERWIGQGTGASLDPIAAQGRLLTLRFGAPSTEQRRAARHAVPIAARRPIAITLLEPSILRYRR
ncbi:MAG: hypothetical protein AB7O91_02235 [Sphingomonas sp.]